MPGALNDSPLAKIGEVLRDLGLRDAQNFLEVANTERTARQQMDDPQSRGVAEALVNLNQFHEGIWCSQYIRQLIYIDLEDYQPTNRVRG